MTKNQKEFQKEVARLQRSINKLTKKPEFQQSIDLPEQPKKVTRTYLSQLKQLKGKDFLTEIDTDTGEILRTPSIPEPYRSKRRPSTSEDYIPTFNIYEEILSILTDGINELNSWLNDEVTPYGQYLIQLKIDYLQQNINWLTEKYDEQGGVYIAYLKQREEEIAELVHSIIYASSQEVVERNLTRLALIIRQEMGYFSEREKEFEWHLGLEYTEETYFREVY